MKQDVYEKWKKNYTYTHIQIKYINWLEIHLHAYLDHQQHRVHNINVEYWISALFYMKKHKNEQSNDDV